MRYWLAMGYLPSRLQRPSRWNQYPKDAAGIDTVFPEAVRCIRQLYLYQFATILSTTSVGRFYSLTRMKAKKFPGNFSANAGTLLQQGLTITGRDRSASPYWVALEVIANQHRHLCLADKSSIRIMVMFARSLALGAIWNCLSASFGLCRC